MKNQVHKNMGHKTRTQAIRVYRDTCQLFSRLHMVIVNGAANSKRCVHPIDLKAYARAIDLGSPFRWPVHAFYRDCLCLGLGTLHDSLPAPAPVSV